MAAIGVHGPRRGLFGRCEPKVSDDAFDALVVAHDDCALCVGAARHAGP